MYKTYGFVFILTISSFQMFSQTSSIQDILNDIEHNNKALQAYSKYISSKTLQNQSENNLENPEFSVYYLPWGNTQEGTYNEFQLSQQFEFPTVYTSRNKLNIEKQKQNEYRFALKRQALLLHAKTICLELIYVNKRIKLEQKRLKQAEVLYSQIQTKFTAQEVSILDLNKSKLNWLQNQFTLDDLNNTRQALTQELTTLNNGHALNFNGLVSPFNTNIPELDRIWESKQANDPSVLKLNQTIDIAKQQVQLQKAKVLPKITLGINQQQVPNSTHFGIYSGVTIPLWGSKNKVKAVNMYLKYEETQAHASSRLYYTQLEKAYQNYQLLLEKYNTYTSVLKDIDTESLLLESYQLGEIPYSTFYMDVQFYRRSYDTFLEMEYQLLTNKADLLKHQL